MADNHARIAVIGAGSIGIATAYYLMKNHGIRDIALIDLGQPMAFTSAQSGENYRNWWPHPAMVAFTNRSIDLMEDISRESDNRIAMTRRGYALTTRDANIDAIVAQIHDGLGDAADRLVRYHTGARSDSYQPFDDADWQSAPSGIDIVQNRALIRDRFFSYAPDIETVVHIRRGGDISGQQLGMHMLDKLRAAGARRITGEVRGITVRDGFRIEIATPVGTETLVADQMVNAAGPFANEIAGMLGVELPIFNTFQQKIAFEDREAAIPRALPFSIDLDSQHIDWTEEERHLLLDDPDLAWLAEEMPGAIHCRPDGGDFGSWLKLGWAYNETPAPATWEPPLDDKFPEIVLRGAARLNPSLKTYYGQLPRTMHHYGGWYTMTEENWPLIGKMGPEDAFMNCAMSGFGTMAACASGELCAAWIAGTGLPDYAREFSIERYENTELLTFLRASSKGVL
ncbi:FAD-binding oxidoreductase [Roseovarius sp. SCSIO 43702]|uniref:NAD(P)/FAD-dependent oxidoreductase n=1 Tax=Roseovarius sp. SCSIO 43702 TaxID=2823043 RepID=UPI001C7329DE|nr:FAD-binding oxidoreductase [Roseovarius sp. SCSIO 43702]QYX56860.1 FAD-binding oxidoreductase [Roseovarius sp. SCSIO 43702]